MVTKTPEELAALTPEEMKAYLRDEEMIVFGRNRLDEPAYKKVKGKPQELGIGAPGLETANHFAAILKYEGPEAHQTALEEIWKRDSDRARKLNLPKPKAA